MKKRVVSLFLICAMLLSTCLVFTGCRDRVQAVLDRLIPEETVDPLIYGVREALQDEYRVTYGAAFDYFFVGGEWISFETKAGVEVVEFTGSCYFRDNYMHALIQFTISKDGETFQPTYLALNGMTQTNEMLNILLTEVFEAYQRSGI